MKKAEDRGLKQVSVEEIKQAVKEMPTKL